MCQFNLFKFEKKPVPNKVTFAVSVNNEITDLIKREDKNSAYIYWYFGCNGFKQGAIDFYKPALTQNIARGIVPFIVDLTAWGALAKKSSLADFQQSAISLDGQQIKTLLSSAYFKSLQELAGDALDLIKAIASRRPLLQPSENYNAIGTTLGELFKEKCPALENIYSLDCAKAYSVLQYIELLFYVEMVLIKKPDTRKICFILPNDEYKYYPLSISMDLYQFLTARGFQGVELTVQIDCFKFGTELRQRPYNIPSSTIKKNKRLQITEVIESDLLNTNPGMILQ